MYTTLFAISAIIIPLILTKWAKRHKKEPRSRDTKNLDSSRYECIFWTVNNLLCRDHIINNDNCGLNCSETYLRNILKLLSAAKVSISMCMYHLTLKQVTDELIRAQTRGVEVRVISDYVGSNMQHSKMRLLREKFDFFIATPPSEQCYMHHKFCVIDAEDPEVRIVFFGSLNLTLQGSTANFEHVLITNNKFLVRRYNEEFEILWKAFSGVEN